MKQTHVQYKEHVQETEYIDLNGITFLVALHSWALLFTISTTYLINYLSQYVDFLSIFLDFLVEMQAHLAAATTSSWLQLRRAPFMCMSISNQFVA